MEDKKDSEEVVIDFSAVRRKLKGFFSKGNKQEEEPAPHTHQAHSTHHTASPHHQPHEHKEHHPISEDHSKSSADEITFDWKQVTAFGKTHAKWLIPLLCILIAMSFSIYFRTMPQRLPITDSWAQGTVYNFYQNQLQQQINQQYPNLPEQNRKALVATQWQKTYQENQDQIEAQVQQLSQQYKSQFRDDQGTLYLLGIDPYYYYRQSALIIKNGFPGTEKKEGVSWDSYRIAPIGRDAPWNFHNWFGAMLYRLVSLFTDTSVMATFFYVGTIFAALTVIPAFFIGRIITKNNAGGFFTAMIIAVTGFFVSRTTGESSDTDVYSVFFPILITWLFLEAITAQKRKHQLLWGALAGLATGLFAFAWTGWWYIATFIIITSIAHLLALLVIHRKNWKDSFKPALMNSGYSIGSYIITASIFVSLFISFREFIRIIFGPLQFLALKAVGVTSYWPNIRTTVAELNVTSLANVINQLDGKLLFMLAVVGIILTLLLKDEQGKRDFRVPFFLAMWLVASLYATTKGVRFILQITPVYAIALGAFMGIAWEYSSRWISKGLKLNTLVTKTIVFLLLVLLLIQPIKTGYSQAYNAVPSVNDGWYNTLTKIKNEAPQNAIITSWWDFGHWFKAIADRPVTFDGGTQVGHDAYWVGKALLTNDEKLTVGIVRMLNCGQNNAFDELDKILNDTPTEIALLNTMVTQTKEMAIKTLHDQGLTAEQIAGVVQYTHCDNPPQDYFITSDDMIGKAGVWGHFGSWNYEKAVMYQKTRNLNRAEAVQFLVSHFNLTEEQADRTHAEIQSTEADRWISPWPSYLSGRAGCQNGPNGTLACPVGTPQGNALILVDLATADATLKVNNDEIVHPASLVYADKEGVKEKRFEGKTVPFSLVLLPAGEKTYEGILADPSLAYSTFTKLFFFEGHGVECFSKFDDARTFTGGRIITWAVDYNCGQSNQVYFLPKEEVEAAHILIATSGRSEEEALKIIEDLQQNVTVKNFKEYAQTYSDDPGSKGQGGYLGWFGKGQMVPEFEQAAFSLKPNEISKPVKTQFGYHLILVLDTRKT
ncbi:TPA: hypothetical protein HA242_07135 [Candidatus Woesearchaeota archaeon]|nr:hypothetical protein [Candidatus Woesearchaeota archaeon]